MRKSCRSLALGVLLLLPVACGLTGSDAPPSPIVLVEGDAALVERFDAGQGRVRLLAVVSPTCASCAVGVRQLATVVDGSSLSRSALLSTPLVLECWPVRMDARLAVHTGLVTKAFGKLIPSSRSFVTVGMTWRLSYRWSSVRTNRQFGASA